MPKEVTNKKSTRTSYEGVHTGRRVMKDIEETEHSNDSSADTTGIGCTRKDKSPERQEGDSCYN